MTTSQKIIGGIAVLGVILGAWALLTPPAPAPTSFGATSGGISNTNAPAANSVLANGVLLPNPTVLDYAVSRVYLYFDKALGYGDGTSIPINEQAVRQAALTAATTTPCNIQSPFTTATSTVEAFLNITTSTSTAQGIEIATALIPNAFTTVVAQPITVAANAFATLGVDTVASSSGQLITVAPSGWVAIGSSNSTALTYGGACSAIFTAIQ